MRVFAEVNAYMTAQPGYVSHRRLHKSLSPEAKYGFINDVEWESPEQWRAAHNPEFMAKASRPEWSFFTSTPELYDIVDERKQS
jgi:hypothetical protein